MEFYRLHLDDTDYFYKDLNNACGQASCFCESTSLWIQKKMK